MPVGAKKLPCCSARSTKLRKASFAKAKKHAEEVANRIPKHDHMTAKKAKAKKAPNKPAKPCKACGKAK